jgi:hypothetical protein
MDPITQPLRVITPWELYWTERQQDRRRRRLRRAYRRRRIWNGFRITAWGTLQVVLAVRFAFIAETQLVLVIVGSTVVLIITWWLVRVHRAQRRHRWRVAWWRYRFIHGEPLPHPMLTNHRQHYSWSTDLRRALFNPPGRQVTTRQAAPMTVQRVPINNQWKRLVR